MAWIKEMGKILGRITGELNCKTKIWNCKTDLGYSSVKYRSYNKK
jgi:hypothetical protein